MIRITLTVVVQVLANAIGLIAAALILDDMSLTAAAFILDILIFTGINVVAQPLIIKLAMQNASSVTGSSALISSFVALIITAWLSDGLQISGAVTWLLATVIIWGASLAAAFLLPAFVFKKWMRTAPTRNAR